VSNYDFIVVTI